jgi:C-terminal processing protease CtpA/Prc
VLLGSPTYGTGTVPGRFEFARDRAAEFAVARAYSPGGAALDRMGALPLVCLATFKMEKDIDTFARNVLAGRFQNERSRLESPTEADIEAARNSCPAPYPTIEAQARALKIAKAIIEKEGVYGKLINM